MSNKILVTHASRAGATGEAAETIGQVFRDAGATVDVYPVDKVTDISKYSAVVLGSAIYMGSWMPDAVKFAKKHHSALNQKPFATFTVSLLMVDQPEAHQQLIDTQFTNAELPLKPVSNGLFRGRLDYNKLSFTYRTIAKMMKAAEEDNRNPQAILDWANNLAIHLV